MTTSAIFATIDALVAQLPTPVANAVAGARVFDGFPTTDDPGVAYLAVGVPDPNDENAANSASARQSWATIGAQSRDEQGEIFCAAVVWDGDGDPSVARAGVHSMTAAVEDYLRAHYSLGVAQLQWTGFGDSIDLQQDQTKTGAVAQVTFSIMFRARI